MVAKPYGGGPQKVHSFCLKSGLELIEVGGAAVVNINL